jgi:hypothetical protein
MASFVLRDARFEEHRDASAAVAEGNEIGSVGSC